MSFTQNFDAPIIETSFYGYNDTDPPELVHNGVFVKADNVYVSDNQIVKVPGSSKVADAIAAKSLNGLTAYEKIATGTKYIITNIDGASNAQLYEWTGSGNFAVIGSANLTKEKTMYFEAGGDYLFGFNGAEAVDYDGTTVTKNRADVPIGYYPKWFHNYLFVAKTDSYPNRLYWSNLGTPTTFTAANYVDVNPGSSDVCTGLGYLQDELFFFKQNTIWSVTGWSGASFSSTTIATQNTNAKLLGYGCVAPESIVSTGNDIYFLSFLGSTPVIRSLKKTQFAVTLGGGVVSKDIKATMASINQNYLSKVVGTFDGRYAMWAIPTGSSTTNNKIIVLDTWNTYNFGGETIYPWTTMTGKNASHFTISTISSKQIVYFADAGATGKVFKIDTSLYTDDGTAITMDVQTKDYMLDAAKKSKWSRQYLTYVTGSAGSLQVKARIDRASDFSSQDSISMVGSSPGLGPTGTFTLGTSLLGGAGINTNRVIFKHLVGHTLGVQFLEETANSCVIHHYELYGIKKGLRAS